jgi:hypothetical protein
MNKQIPMPEVEDEYKYIYMKSVAGGSNNGSVL